MNNYLVFREEPLSDIQIQHRNKHNERRADNYNNGNIDIALSGNNYYFKKPTATYEEMFKERLDAGKINIKGLKPDAAHYSEILVAVNREYWVGKSVDEVKAFFQVAYNHLAKKFGEENILSAVIHADEISDGMINYHMHMVAIPIVDKKRYFTKRSKEYKELAKQIGEKNILANDERLLKQVEHQVSHSKFFESVRDNEHKRITYSYSIWQDDLLNALKTGNVGTDLHRGITNTKAPHLHPTQYKQLMAKILEKADGLLLDIKAEPIDDIHYRVEKQSLDAIYDLQEEVSQEKAAYELAVDALKTEQDKVFDRQNQVYQVALRQKELDADAKELKKLKEQAEQLTAENKELRNILELLKDKIWKLCHCFKKIIESWVQLRTDETADANSLLTDIDNEVKNGVSILNNTSPENRIIIEK